jgi:hypothetical protein
MATTYYVNPGAADDTGDGTAMATAKKLCDSALALCSGGDEVRIRASSTTAAGTQVWTWTHGSVSVTCSGDHSADVAAGDFIRLDSETTGPNSRMWWRVSSVAYGAPNTTITLYQKYYSQTLANPTAGTISKLVPFASTGETLASGGGTAGSPVTVTGGWDAAGTTQDGYTWFKQSGPIGTGNGLTITDDYLNVSNARLGVAGYAVGYYLNGCDYLYLQDIAACGCNTRALLSDTTATIGLRVSDLYICAHGGGGSDAINPVTAGPAGLWGAIYAYGCGNLLYNQGVRLTIQRIEAIGCSTVLDVVNPVVIGTLYVRSCTAIKNASDVLALVGEADTGAGAVGSSTAVSLCQRDATSGNEYHALPLLTVDKATGRGGSGYCYRMDPANKTGAGWFLLPPFLVASGDTPTAFTFYQCSTSAAGSTVPSVEVVLFQSNGLTIADHATVTVTDVATAWNGSETQHTVDLSGTVAYDGVVQFGLLVKDNSAGDALFYFDDPALA